MAVSANAEEEVGQTGGGGVAESQSCRVAENHQRVKDNGSRFEVRRSNLSIARSPGALPHSRASPFVLSDRSQKRPADFLPLSDAST